MRKDMYKVIVERERTGGGAGERHYARDYANDVHPRDDEEFESLPTRMSMNANRYTYNTKNLNENLNPLRRFLERSVGRKWDDVFSEICEHINSDTTVQQHVLSHIKDFIDIKTYMDDTGVIWSREDYGGPRPVNLERSYHSFSTLYVHPLTRLICKVKTNAGRKQRLLLEKQRREEEQKVHVKVDKYLHFYKIDDLWYRVGMADITPKLFRIETVESLYQPSYMKTTERQVYEIATMLKQDILRKLQSSYRVQIVGRYTRAGRLSSYDKAIGEAINIYGNAVYAVSIKSVNKKDKKKYHLE